MVRASAIAGVLFVSGVLSAALFAACGDECGSPSDCDFGQACFDGECVDTAAGATCTVDADCRSAETAGSTAICSGGQCRLFLVRPEVPDFEDAGSPGDGGDGGDAATSPDAGTPDATTPDDECDPLDPTSCSAGETCEFIGLEFVCLAAGTNGIGEGCNNLTGETCTSAGICLNVDNTGNQCYEACPPGGGSCTGGTSCTALVGFDFGVCR